MCGEVDGAHPALSEQVFEAVLLVQHLTNVFFRTRHSSHAENGLYYGSGEKSVSIRPPPIRADWLAVGWLLRGRDVRLLRIVLKALDLFDRVEHEGSLVLIDRKTTLHRQPRF